MKAIVSRFVPQSNTKPARYSAADGDGNRVYVPAKDELNSDQNHTEAVKKLCAKMGWHGSLVRGWLKRGDWVWVWFAHNTVCNKPVVEPRDHLHV